MSGFRRLDSVMRDESRALWEKQQQRVWAAARHERDDGILVRALRGDRDYRTFFLIFLAFSTAPALALDEV
jgi:hypothetical protein